MADGDDKLNSYVFPMLNDILSRHRQRQVFVFVNIKTVDTQLIILIGLN